VDELVEHTLGGHNDLQQFFFWNVVVAVASNMGCCICNFDKPY
jgi:hypothetical protein